jgi:hypothetical protein
MKKNVVSALVLLSSLPALSQTPDRNAVTLPITQLFKGMSLGDSAMVHRAFVNNVTFVTVAKDRSGESTLIPEPLGEFLTAVGTPHAEAWNEPIWEVVVQVDGIFAQVWAKYAFFLGKNFSHCGVDAFHLIQGGDGQWKIFHLADTRQREGCNVPQAIRDQFR